MPVLSMSDGSVLAYIARHGRYIGPERRDRVLAMIEAPEARNVALLLLEEPVNATHSERSAAEYLSHWASTVGMDAAR